jgi:hypothetical protein
MMELAMDRRLLLVELVGLSACCSSSTEVLSEEA